MATTTAEIQRLFLSAANYAVVGASKDQTKYGTKVRERENTVTLSGSQVQT